MTRIFFLLLALIASGSGQSTFPRQRATIVSDRIVGGTKTSIHDYPYQASLLCRGRHLCGGSIISEVWCLTAAHCTPSKIPVGLLSLRVGSSQRAVGGTVHRVVERLNHPLYDNTTDDYDFSMLRTTRIIYGPTVHPIPMADRNYEIEVGSWAIITGFGYTNENGTASSDLNVVALPVWDQQECRRVYSGTRITDQMFCAGVQEGGRDSCQGDSGGPCVINGVLVGVVSWGNGCARKGYPGVYAKVSSARAWILTVMTPEPDRSKVACSCPDGIHIEEPRTEATSTSTKQTPSTTTARRTIWDFWWSGFTTTMRPNKAVEIPRKIHNEVNTSTRIPSLEFVDATNYHKGFEGCLKARPKTLVADGRTRFNKFSTKHQPSDASIGSLNDNNEDIQHVENAKGVEDVKCLENVDDENDIIHFNDTKQIANAEDITDIFNTEKNKNAMEKEDINYTLYSESIKNIKTVNDIKNTKYIEDVEKDIRNAENNDSVEKEDIGNVIEEEYIEKNGKVGETEDSEDSKYIPNIEKDIRNVGSPVRGHGLESRLKQIVINFHFAYIFPNLKI